MADIASGLERCSASNEAGDYTHLLRSGGLELYFQPIVNLRSGEVIGFEGLGRLNAAGRIIPPAMFLPHFMVDDLLELLFQSIDQGVLLLRQPDMAHRALTLALNVDPLLLLDPNFAAKFLSHLGSFDPKRITVELLESGDILNKDLAYDQLTTLRTAGIKVALDDVGSGYSSLMRLSTMPVDKIKLDQIFVRELHHKPENLVFVSSVMSLASGLNKKLIVEGVETPEILDALRVLGVEFVQGYAIGRPMAQPSVADWLAAHKPVPATSRPHSLLGVYAAHLRLIEVCHSLLSLPLRSVWADGAADPHKCLVGELLDEYGLHETKLGLAHKHLHRILPIYSDHQAEWREVAEGFRLELHAAIRQNPLLPMGGLMPPGVTACRCAQPALNVSASP